MIKDKRGILRSLIILASALLFISSLIFLVSSLTSEERAALESELNSLTADLDSQGYSWLVNNNLNIGGDI
ncbi:MAG: hypothetical protein AABW67_04500 [Nanoarchaeota archaeon]